MSRLEPINRIYGVNNMLDDFFNTSQINVIQNTFKVDVIDNDTNYLVEAELPGVAKEDITVELNKEQLTISVKDDKTVEKMNGPYVHKERTRSSATRKFNLADSVSEGITAKLTDGLLKITIPKQSNKTKITIE